MGDLADKLTELIIVDLLGLVSILWLRLLHLLTRVLAALFARVRRFRRLVVAAHATGTLATSGILPAARLVRLEAGEATIRGQGEPLEHKLPGHLTSRVNIMHYNKTFTFTGLPAKCDSKC